MFDNVTQAPPDAIFGLTEAMRRDPRPDKINLGAGVYKDESGRTPILEVVKEAELRLVEKETTKSYLPMAGHPDYARAVQGLVLGAESPTVTEGRAATAQTPGGTGALRLIGDFLRSTSGPKTVWLTDPTWANHRAVFEAAGHKIDLLPYYDPEARGLALTALLEALERVGEGDIVVLHACCHNPTGVDPSLEDWRVIAEILGRRKALPLLDFAYQGFRDGVQEDAAAVRLLADSQEELVICSSFSKNFGLYGERVGAATVIARTGQQASAVSSWIEKAARCSYSNPPIHGAAVVTTVLDDPELRQRWDVELGGMRERIRRMRLGLASALDAREVFLSPAGNNFVVGQNGMFSFSGLGREQVLRLREEHGVYMVDSGRLNVAGINEGNLDRLGDAIADVLGARVAG